MGHMLPAIIDDPLAPAFALARGVPAPFVAAALGALAGVALFGLFVALYRRRSRRARPMATDVVLVAPHPVAGALVSHGTSLHPGGMPGFVPSSALSARAFAKMGYELADSENAAVAPTAASFPAVPRAPEIETGPMSAVMIASSASVLAAAPIADLDLDDASTEVS